MANKINDYSGLTLDQLIKNISSARFFDLPRMVAEAFIKTLEEFLLPPPPKDNIQYGIQNGEWTEITSSSGGVESVSGDMVDNTDPQNPIINIPATENAKIYLARVSRVGAGALAVTEIKNTTGETFVWDAPFAGNISIECANPIFANDSCYFSITTDQINSLKNNAYATISKPFDTILAIGTFANVDAVNATDVANIKFLVRVELV